ncbi:hypothetical protein Sjap_024167 [Stephania japonica]|uniref:Retrotransposon gag domain-containing protein n=1 Tax=Stephania japonica TaxID=461633 RepID=A0AAP0HPW3_9MAGN
MFLSKTVVLLPVQAEAVPIAPIVQTDIVLAPVAEAGIRATTEARQLREFKRHNLKEFFGGTNLVAAEMFLKSHKKVHSIIMTEEHMRASISSSMLFREADDWWTTIVSTRGFPKDWIEFKTQFNLKYFPPIVLKAKRN